MKQQIQREASHASSSDSFVLAAARLNDERPLRNRRLQQIAAELRGGRVSAAYHELTGYLQKHPDDANAVFLMAEALVRLGRRNEAAARFADCVERAPDFSAARFGYARLLLRLNRFEAALSEANRLLANDGGNPLFLQLKANALLAMGEGDQSLAIWRRLATENPTRAESWIKYGDALRASGSQEDAVAAYRTAIACSSTPGLAWWSLSNLKTVRFGDADLNAMQQELTRPDLTADDRINLLFALGKAYEDRGAWRSSFEHYAKANAAKRFRAEKYPAVPASRVAENKMLFTPAFFRTKIGAGCKAPDPIFVLGQQRSGSTLIEQILSSHSALEGTGELKYIPALAQRLEQDDGSEHGTEYPGLLGQLGDAELRLLGEEYLADSDVHRRLKRAHFVDKNPGNYHHVGMIHLILPNARIIDVRRHPAACCLSMFKQNLGTASLRLNELGQNYRDYIELMTHFDRVLPGKVHRLIYEDLVSNPEAQIRRMLDYLELPFEESCLRFYESGRMVVTPSSEQVRQPISVEAMDNWRNFEPWLAPLLDSLGSALASYPDVPQDLR